MKALLLAAAMIATPAFAFDADPLIERLDEVVYTCDAGENHDGEKISEAVKAQACAEQIDLTMHLTENGYCKVGVDWKPC